jgi:hypothetical protein
MLDESAYTGCGTEGSGAMGKLNVGRVVVGGVAASVVMMLGELANGALSGDALTQHLAELGLSEPEAAAFVPVVGTTFATGILLIWLYAAIRPRFGAGPKTALIAGFVLWLPAVLFNSIASVAAGFLPSGMPTVIGTGWSLIQFCLAALVGAWLYREETPL